MAFYNGTTNCFTNIIITHTYLVWPFTIPQLTDLHKIIITQTYLVWPFTIPQLTALHKHNYNTDLLSMAFYNTTTN